VFDIAATCLVLTALLAYLNHRFAGLPTAIGVMAIALVLSLGLLGLDLLGLDHGLRDFTQSFLKQLDFSQVLMQGMLSMLLFAGALHVDLSALKRFAWQVASLALLGTVASTFLIGFAMHAVLPWIGITLPLVYCLLFGALISPTDPIAVLGILRSAGAPKTMEIVIAGESLFNDGVGVVFFTLILSMALAGQPPTVANGAMLLLREAGGGIVFGLVLGALTFYLLKSIDSYQEEVLITLAAVLGGYALASHLHVSGPLAMVVVGLIIGNDGRALAMSSNTRAYIDMFWELLDAILNSALFVLIGLQVIIIPFSPTLALAGAATVAITLAARLLLVGVPVGMMRSLLQLPRGAWQILTWGGLRGGISVALALSLPGGAARDTIVALTYIVVIFSILAQGLTIGPVVRKVIA
jgi:CPA1 family monovalent cation:H+ antiporter